MKKRGVTLIEVMMVVGIMSMIAVGVGFSLNRSRAKAGPTGLAMTIAEELRRARQEAVTRRRPTALVFPSGGGAFRHMQSFYVLDGEDHPRITRALNFKQEYGQAMVYIGDWPFTPGSKTSTGLATPGSKWGAFDVNQWLNSCTVVSDANKDYAYVFLPDGSLRTNGLTAVDGSYRIVIANGVQYSGNTLNKAGECMTVGVSAVGGVQVTGGLYANGGVQTGGSLGSIVPSKAPAVVIPPTADPKLIGGPKIFPDPSTYPKPPDVDAMLTKDQYITLETTAVSPSGDQLFCNWQVTPPPGKTDKGAFSIVSRPGSSSAGGRMEWDPNADNGSGGKGAWRSVWQWRPPKDAAPNDKFQLACEVQNYDGGKVDAQIPDVRIVPPGKVFFVSNRSGPWLVHTMDENGAHARPYLQGASDISATLNGSRLAYIKGGELWVHMPNDPNNDIRLVTGGTPCSVPAISPSGNFVAFRQGGQIMVMRTAQGANPVSVRSVPRPGDPGWNPGDPSYPPVFYAETERLCWKFDGTLLLYPRPDGFAAARITPDGPGGRPRVTDLGIYVDDGSSGSPISGGSWAPDDVLYWTNNYNRPSQGYDPWTFHRDPDGTIGRSYTTVGIEETMLERCPRGGPEYLACRAAAGTPPGERHIHKIVGRLVPGGPPAGTSLLQLTPPGTSNIRPVWTQ